MGLLNRRKAFSTRGTAFYVNCCRLQIPITCPVTLQRTVGDPHTHMTEQPISLDGADSVIPGALNANAEGGDHVGDVVAIVGPRTTLVSARDPETVFFRGKHEQERSKPLRSNNPLWIFFMIYLQGSLPGITVCKICEANGDFVDAEVRFGLLPPLSRSIRHEAERASRGSEIA